MNPCQIRIITATLLGLTMLNRVCGLPKVIRIGGLFGDAEDRSVENAFRYAISRVNRDKYLLRGSTLSYDIQHLPSRDSFQAAKRACNQAGLGVAAIFGPQSTPLASHINSMSNSLEIPHIEARLEPRIDLSQQFSINMYPEAAMLGRAYLDMLKYFKWRKFAIIYGNQNDLLLLQDIIKAPLNTDVQIVVRQASKSNMRSMLKEITKMQIDRIIAHLSLEETNIFLKSALQLGMVDGNHHFVLTNLDLSTLDLEDYRHNFLNLTALRLLSNTSHTSRILREMAEHQYHSRNTLLNKTGVIKTEAALLYDAVFVLAHALQLLDKTVPLQMANLSCQRDEAWAFGSSLYSYLNLVEMEGLTGKLVFDRGRRTAFKLDIIQLMKDGLTKIGEWSHDTGVNFTTKMRRMNLGVALANKTLNITSLLEKPYVMYKKNYRSLKGNDRFEGFCIDLLKEIAQEVNFEYRINLVPDATYGTYDPVTKEWNGMVRQLMIKEADLAVASLTINYAREQVIDFTTPFMNLGISILFKRPEREKPGLFSFLNPLAFEIWVYVIAAYFAVSFIMFILARFSPYEWFNPHPCFPDHDTMENQFTLSNSFWFAVGTLMQQGSDINPRAVSTRIVGGIWWFFTLIIISSYTANLAAFLTVERMISPIESAEDLSKQTTIEYGTISGGSTMTFFRESKIMTYERMWKFMDSRENVFVKNSEEGIARVKQGNYAFLMESTMIEYTIQRECGLMQVGGLLDSKGYGIGTPQGSQYRDKISDAILILQEKGRIQMLYNKWWKNSGTCSHDDKKKDSKASSLGVENVGGIFVVLLAGLALAVIVAIFEFMWNSRKNAEADKVQQSVCSEMAEELRFAVRCHGSTKKPKLRRQCSKCVHSPEPTVGIDSPNGVLQLKDIRQRSPLSSREHTHFHFHDAPDTYPDKYRRGSHPEKYSRDPYPDKYSRDPYPDKYNRETLPYRRELQVHT